MFIPEDHTRSPFPPLLGEQKDIRYFGTDPRSLLNSPATTGMSFWSINPYVGCAFGCAYCYARYAHRYVAERLVASDATADGAHEELAELPPWLAFERRIFVKREAGAILRRELRRPARFNALQRESVVIGTATDPYQPAEARFQLTRSCIRELAASGTPLSIVTRGPLIVRDIDVLQTAAREVPVSVYVSLPTLDERVWRTTEPGTAPPASRLRAIRALADAGIEVGVGMAPILPGLSDRPEQLEAVVTAARAAGARGIWAGVVHLRPGVREHFLEALARDWPEQVEHYEALFGTRAYLPAGTVSAITDPARRAKASTRFSSSRQPVRAEPRQLALAL